MKRFTNFLSSGLDFVLEVPGRVVDVGEDIQDVGFGFNQDIINLAQGASQQAETRSEPLRQTKAREYSERALNWLAVPLNFGLVVAILIFLFFIIPTIFKGK